MNKYAFISYSHKDKSVVKWLHRQLEHYKLPTGISNDFIKSKYMRPVFRDVEDLNTGILSEELHKHLISSRYLIVICSKASASSKWVNEEIVFFVKNREWSNIIPVFLNDSTQNVEELWPEAIKNHVAKNQDQELLGIDYYPNRRKAFVQVVSRMLGVDFDVLWKRYQKARRRSMLLRIIGLFAIACLFYFFAIPVNLKIVLQEQSHNLPAPDKAELVVNNVAYPLSKLDTTLIVKSLPGYMRCRQVDISFRATYYQDIEQTKKLGIGVSDEIFMTIQRDSTFSVFSGNVIDDDGHSIEEATVEIGTHTAITDATGKFRIVLPLSEQAPRQHIKVSKDGYRTYERKDEVPSCSLCIILFK